MGLKMIEANNTKKQKKSHRPIRFDGLRYTSKSTEDEGDDRGG